MYEMPADPSPFVYLGFILLSLFMIAGFGFVSKSKVVAGVSTVWAFIVAVIAGAGVLADFSSVPPRIIFVFIPTIIGVILVAFSNIGRSLTYYSVTFLIGYQSFRILVELLIHQAVTVGIAPPQMTWTGYNFDIVTGVTALLLIPFANRLPVWALHIWNFTGLGLLLLVVSVAILSMPTPFQQLKPNNVWVAYFPYIWLPVVLVSAALMGHLVLFRKLITGKPAPSDK